jgi:hypothetical protein
LGSCCMRRSSFEGHADLYSMNGCPGRRTGPWIEAGGLAGCDPQARTRRIAPVAPPASVPSSPIFPPTTGIGSAGCSSIKHEFFNGIRPSRCMILGMFWSTSGQPVSVVSSTPNVVDAR